MTDIVTNEKASHNPHPTGNDGVSKKKTHLNRLSLINEQFRECSYLNNYSNRPICKIKRSGRVIL